METIEVPIKLPDVFSTDSIPEAQRPLADDWKLIQGGKPDVEPVDPEKGMWKIIHRYINPNDPEGTGAIIPTSAPIVENWEHPTVAMTLPDGRRIKAPTALLWKFHGRGCETRSRTKYERVPLDQIPNQ